MSGAEFTPIVCTTEGIHTPGTPGALSRRGDLLRHPIYCASGKDSLGDVSPEDYERNMVFARVLAARLVESSVPAPCSDLYRVLAVQDIGPAPVGFSPGMLAVAWRERGLCQVVTPGHTLTDKAPSILAAVTPADFERWWITFMGRETFPCQACIPCKSHHRDLLVAGGLPSRR